MADAASGSTDRSIQVKLVLLGKYSIRPSCPPFDPLLLAGEAAVGKSSVVLRFVWPTLTPSLTLPT